MKIPHGRRTEGSRVADEQWTAFLRSIFRLCADRFSPGDELALFALTIANHRELLDLVDQINTSRESLKIEPGPLADLHDAAAYAIADENRPGWGRLREAFFRLTRRYDAVVPFIVNLIHDGVRRTSTDELAPVPAITSDLGRIFSLEECETRILGTLYALENTEPLADVFRRAPEWMVLSVMAGVCGVETREFVERTAPGGRLEKLGLIALRGGRDELADIGLSRPVLFSFRSNTLDDLRAGLFVETPRSRYTVQEFPLPAEEIRNCAASITGGFPTLLSGNPGVGKTEFARTLAASLGRTAHTLASVQDRSNERGRASATMSRLGAVRMAANLLDRSRDVLIVDEADAILQSATGLLGLFGFGTGNYDKAELNDLLESLPVPSIWITNAHHMIPSSAIRRFGHVVDFPHPNVDVRVRMLSDQLGALAHDDTSWIRNLAAEYELTPAAIERTARIVSAELESSTLDPDEVPTRVTRYLRQNSSGALSHDIRRLPAVNRKFDPRFCSTSESLERLERIAVHRVAAGLSLRLLLGGPPGTGKTQYALWLARQLGRDVVLKRPSDLLSKYVGASEQQIAATFRRAEQAGSVLVIDEADALLYNRETAVRSWEHSQLAEFLQQIQEFEGILVACTNRVDAVDPALRRRFHKHLTFGPVSDEILPGALAHIFPHVSFSRAEMADLRQGPPLMMSDLATAAEMMEIAEESDAQTSAVVEEILANARTRDRTREIGF